MNVGNFSSTKICFHFIEICHDTCFQYLVMPLRLNRLSVLIKTCKQKYDVIGVINIHLDLPIIFIIWRKWFVTLQYSMIGLLENQKNRYFSSNESYKILVIKPWSTNFPYKSSWFLGPTNIQNRKSPTLVHAFCYYHFIVGLPARRKSGFLNVSFW